MPADQSYQRGLHSCFYVAFMWQQCRQRRKRTDSFRTLPSDRIHENTRVRRYHTHVSHVIRSFNAGYMVQGSVNARQGYDGKCAKSDRRPILRIPRRRLQHGRLVINNNNISYVSSFG